MQKSETFHPGAMTLATILLSSMVILMGAAAVAPALNYIGQEFGISDASVTALVISLPALSVAVSGFLMGYLADRFGKAKILFISLGIFTVAGVLPFFLGDFTQILICRFILGTGLTGISSASTALIGEYWTGADRVKVIGYQSAAIGAGKLVLETIGGSLADIGWNYPFLIYLIGLLIIILGIFSVREPVHARNHSAETVRNTPAGKVLFCYIMVFAEMFMMFSMPTCFSYYIPEVLPGMTDMAGLLAGILLGVTGTSQAFFSLFHSRSSSKASETGAYSRAFVLMAVGMALMYVPVFISGQTLTLAVLAASMVSVGFSLGLLMPSVVGSLARLSTPETSGKIMGGYAVFLNISTFIAGITVPMLCGFLGSGYAGVFGLLALVSAVLSAVLAFKRMAERRSAQP